MEFAITLSFNENAGIDRSKYLSRLILNRAANKTFGRRGKTHAIKTYGCIDYTKASQAHTHLLAKLTKSTKDTKPAKLFYKNLCEAAKHFGSRFEVFMAPVTNPLGYHSYICSKHIPNNQFVW